jgi:multiple sugar transport system permease protein
MTTHTIQPQVTNTSLRGRARARNYIPYIILTLITTLVVIPVIWMLITSLKKDTELLAYPIQVFPAVPQWENYVSALSRVPFLRYGFNSVFLAVMFAVLTMLTSSMSGYAFARLRAPGSKRLYAIVIGLLLVPGIVTMIPQFMLFSRLGLVNTYMPWVLWGLAGSPFHIFMFRQFFMAFPKELEDAAEIDGCGPYRIFWQIFLPNARPVLATSFIFSFGWVWGDYLTPLIYLTDSNTTLAVKLATAYVDPVGNRLPAVTIAACVIYTLVPIFMFFLGQKQILRGVVTSGLKG